MERKAQNYLTGWLQSPNRKPLIIRGARQVGKTWLVRNLAKESHKELFEINFERDPNAKTLFVSNDPLTILKGIGAFFGKEVDLHKSILFLDEIQSAKEVLSKLRWFAEELPELAVIAAGSLLEFLLQEHEYSMPVGRINFMYLEPLSFNEFLRAQSNQVLLDFLNDFKLDEEMPLALHKQALALFKEYTLVGGMPAAVETWILEKSLNKVAQVHHDLLATYRADFAKYRGKISLERLDEALLSTPRLLGQKFVFSQINQNASTQSLKQAVNLLNQAQICHSIFATAGNGLPLGAEKREKFFKQIFLDVGLLCSSLGISFLHLSHDADLNLVNNGAIAEQVVGQLLRTIEPFFVKPELFYWLREQAGSQAEVDYLIQNGPTILPIEVKAGSEGKLKSLTLFMKEKNLKKAVKISSALPKITHKEFTLFSVPFYLTEQITKLVNQS